MGALLLAVLIARLPLRSLLPDINHLPGVSALPRAAGNRPGEEAGQNGSHPSGQASPTANARTAAARKEGKVVWWFSLDNSVGDQVLAAFHARYPDISVAEHLGLPSAQLYPRLLNDLKSGAVDADVITLTDADLAYDLQQREAWASYLSPQAAGIADVYRSDPSGLWAVTDLDPVGVVWNSQAIGGSPPITSYWDLVQPAWKGRLGIGESPGESQLASWHGLSGTLGLGFWDQVSKNRPEMFASPEAMLNQVAAGKVPVAVNAPWSVARRYLRQGGPLRLLLPPEGVPARYSASGVLARAPRPNAARLFLDFLLSPEGQRLMGPNLRGTYPTRAEAAGPANLPSTSSFKLMGPPAWEEYGKAGRDFPRIWERTIGKWR